MQALLSSQLVSQDLQIRLRCIRAGLLPLLDAGFKLCFAGMAIQYHERDVTGFGQADEIVTVGCLQKGRIDDHGITCFKDLFGQHL